MLFNSWTMFKTKCIPDDACADQITDMRRAFYAGATALMAGLKISSDMEESAGLKVLTDLDQELKDFLDLVEMGGA